MKTLEYQVSKLLLSFTLVNQGVLECKRSQSQVYRLQVLLELEQMLSFVAHANF